MEKTRQEIIIKAVESFAERVVIISVDHRILAAAGRFSGQNPGQLTGKSCHQVLAARESVCEDCHLEKIFQTGRPAVRQVAFYEDSTKKVLSRHLFPVFDGRKVEAVAVVDLDPRHFSDRNSETSSANAFLKNLIMSSVDGVIASDMTGRILIFNEAASQITGYDQEEALTELDIREIYPADKAREVMHLLRSDVYGGKGKLKAYRVDLLRKDGTTVPINLSAAIVYDHDEEVATVGFFYDLREKLRMERELQETQVQLLQAAKMSSLGKLAAGVAHQLNNPLGGIVLYTQLLMEEYNLDPAAVQDLKRIIEDAERCQNIVRELLDFARQSTLELRQNDINRAIRRTIFLLENQPLFKGIDIVTELDPDLPLVPSDIQQLNHVFMNLILNAAEAMDGQGVLTIKTRVSSLGDRVCIEVSDTGPGIPNDVLPHIFDPFFTTKEEGQGTGLGLSVSYGVIENHKGRITACSAQGQGASFQVELPLKQPGLDRESE